MYDCLVLEIQGIFTFSIHIIFRFLERCYEKAAIRTFSLAFVPVATTIADFGKHAASENGGSNLLA
jgi:hypothetical protein